MSGAGFANEALKDLDNVSPAWWQTKGGTFGEREVMQRFSGGRYGNDRFNQFLRLQLWSAWRSLFLV